MLEPYGSRVALRFPLMTYFLGVDGGASKTAALVVDEHGKPLGRGLAGGSNHLRVGIEEATRNVEHAVNKALVEAGIAIRNIEYAYCGIAGSDHPVHRQRVVDSLSIFFPRGNFIVDTDARVALTGAVGFGAGIVIISGTGSVAFGRNAAGEEARAGGWGPTLGDEGSGYWIAREGLSAIVRAHDGRGFATKMTDLLCAEYDMCEPDELPRFVYAATTHVDDIARYGKLVIEAANAGDDVARDILDPRRLGARRVRAGHRPQAAHDRHASSRWPTSAARSTPPRCSSARCACASSATPPAPRSSSRS